MRRKYVWLGIGVLVAILIPFFLWEESITGWTREFLARKPGRVAVGVVLAGLLASDIVLPVPSSLVSAAAGALLGAGWGTLVSWIGMTAGCILGYGLGHGAGRRLLSDEELARMVRYQGRFGSLMVAIFRGVPVLAEASVVFAGMTRMPFGRFLAWTSAANLVVSAFYALTVAALTAGGSMAASSVHEFTMKSIDGKQVSLNEYKGKVMLVVNVASKCGYTPQYTGLEALYRKYKDQGFVVLAFPANNFLWQEPGSDAEIQQFCKRTYDVTFPIFSKISVVGSDKAPLYDYLTDAKTNRATSGMIKWNFTKFLVDQDGKVIGRFGPGTDPQATEVTTAIDKALAAK